MGSDAAGDAVCLDTPAANLGACVFQIRFLLVYYNSGSVTGRKGMD
jgi:hypothetical protein